MFCCGQSPRTSTWLQRSQDNSTGETGNKEPSATYGSVAAVSMQGWLLHSQICALTLLTVATRASTMFCSSNRIAVAPHSYCPHLLAHRCFWLCVLLSTLFRSDVNLWPEELPRGSVVLLSGGDLLVDANNIHMLLEQQKELQVGGRA